MLATATATATATQKINTKDEKQVFNSRANVGSAMEFREVFFGLASRMGKLKKVLLTLKESEKKQEEQVGAIGKLKTVVLGGADQDANVRKELIEYYMKGLFDNKKEHYSLDTNLAATLPESDLTKSKDLGDLIESLTAIDNLLRNPMIDKFISVAALGGARKVWMDTLLQQQSGMLIARELIPDEMLKLIEELKLEDSPRATLSSYFIQPAQYLGRLRLLTETIVKHVSHIINYYKSNETEQGHEKVAELSLVVDRLQESTTTVQNRLNETNSVMLNIKLLNNESLAKTQDCIKNLKKDFLVKLDANSVKSFDMTIICFLRTLLEKYMIETYTSILKDNNKEQKKLNNRQKYIMDAINKFKIEFSRIEKTKASENEKNILLALAAKKIIVELLNKPSIAIKKGGVVKTNLKKDLTSLLNYITAMSDYLQTSQMEQDNDLSATDNSTVSTSSSEESDEIEEVEEEEKLGISYSNASLSRSSSLKLIELNDEEQKDFTSNLKLQQKKIQFLEQENKKNQQLLADNKNEISKLTEKIQIVTGQLEQENKEKKGLISKLTVLQTGIIQSEQQYEDERKDLNNTITSLKQDNNYLVDEMEAMQNNKTSPWKYALAGGAIVLGVASIAFGVGAFLAGMAVFYCATLLAIHLMAQIGLYVGGSVALIVGAYVMENGINHDRAVQDRTRTILNKSEVKSPKPECVRRERDEKSINIVTKRNVYNDNNGIKITSVLKTPTSRTNSFTTRT